MTPLEKIYDKQARSQYPTEVQSDIAILLMYIAEAKKMATHYTDVDPDPDYHPNQMALEFLELIQ